MLEKRRYRIVLMGEEHIQGAGGRITTIYPVIGNVWASITEKNSQTKMSADRQFLGETVSFQVPYASAFMTTKRVKWDMQDYNVTGLRRTFNLHPSISIDAVVHGG